MTDSKHSIYLDNGATSFPKPNVVAQAVYDYMTKNGTNINRGGYDEAYSAASVVLETREKLNRLMNGYGARNAIFTPGNTYSLNFLIKGLARKGDRFLISSMEHNAVYRPMHQLSEAGIISYECLPCDAEGRLILEEAERMITEDIRAVVLSHASNVSGTLQPMEEIAKLTHDAGMFLLVDCVTSLGGVEVPVDRLGFDMTYSGTQKCLNCPPGLAPMTVSKPMADWIRARQIPVKNWYLDLNMIMRYWGEDRFYHHTAPINMIYALNEALRIILEEGIEKRWERHWANARRFWGALEAMGMKLVVEEKYRLPSLTTYYTPEGVNEAAVRNYLMDKYKIEIGGGLGELKGKIHRVGLMGVNSDPARMTLLIAALGDALKAQGCKCDVNAALDIING